MKRKIKFGHIILIYVALWVVLIIGVSAKLWSVFSEYQKNYVFAAQSANPDLLMEKQIESFSDKNIGELASTICQEVSCFETIENIQSELCMLVSGKDITYKREEHFSNRKPLYVVEADGEVIGYVSMRMGKESDLYGFHKPVVDEIMLDTNILHTREVMIEVPEGAEVQVNGINVSDEYLSERTEKISYINQKAEEITGNNKRTKTYQIDKLIQSPDIEVLLNGSRIEMTCNDAGEYHWIEQTKQEFVDEVSKMVLAAGEKYILNTNQLIPFAEVSVFFERNSEAYNNVLSVQSGLTWAGKPDKLEITDTEILEMHQYSEGVFTAKTIFKIYREYREKTYEEEMTYEWLIVNNNANWQIRNFSLVK